MTQQDYQKQISTRIHDQIDNWLDRLKSEQPELCLTKQWQTLFPKGFRPGQNVLPVVTGSKAGQYLIGEVSFYLPDNLELEMDTLELNLKSAPYEKTTQPVRPPLLDDSVDLLNDIVTGLNEFLQGLNLSSFKASPMPASMMPASIMPFRLDGSKANQPASMMPVNLKVNGLVSPDIELVKKQIMQSEHLPDWVKTIDSREVREQLLQKLVETLIHYRQQIGKEVDLADFFGKYTAQLLKANRLYHFCKYKAKSVKLDEEGLCTENYCSKKPYRDPCSLVTLRFGMNNDE